MASALFVVHDARGALLDGAAHAHGRHHRECERAGCKKYQQPHEHGVAVGQDLLEYGEDRVHGQILKLTMRYMMKFPTPIQHPAKASAILVRSSFQTLP